MGYKQVTLNQGSPNAYTTIHTDRHSDDPGKFADAISLFEQTDAGKLFVANGGRPMNYLRSREEYVFLNVIRYLSRMQELPEGGNDSLSPVYKADGSVGAYVLNNDSILKLRRQVQSTYAPLYKPFRMKDLAFWAEEMLDNLPDFPRKALYKSNRNVPFVESAAAYKVNGKTKPMLGIRDNAPDSNGTRYSNYFNYVINRLVQISENRYDEMCRSSNCDYVMVYTDPLFDSARAMLDDIENANGSVVSTFYAKTTGAGIDFYTNPQATGDPIFTYTYQTPGREAYFTYTNDRGQVLRYGKGYDPDGKVIGDDPSGYRYQEPSYTVALDQEAYYGANGISGDRSAENKPGLLSVMSPFISSSDAKVFAKSFNPETVYTKDMAQSLFDTMTWLYSEGYSFSINSSRRANSSAVELSLNEMPGNQKIIFTPDEGNLTIRFENSMFNYEIKERSGVSVADSTKLMLRYLRGDLSGHTIALGTTSKRTRKERGMSRASIEIKGDNLVQAGLMKEDEVFPDEMFLKIDAYPEIGHFVPRFCYEAYQNGAGVDIDPEGAYRIQMYMVTAMHNFVGAMRFSEINEAVKKAAESGDFSEESIGEITALLSDDVNVSDLQKKYIMDLIDIYGYVGKSGMLEADDPVAVIPVSEFVQRLRSVDELEGQESFRLSADQFTEALMNQVCREQIGELYDISNIDRDMLQSVWKDNSGQGQTMSDLTDAYGEYLPATRIMDIDPGQLRYASEVTDENKVNMALRANDRCRFYPGKINAAGVLTYGHGNVSGITRTALLAALLQMRFPSDRIVGTEAFSASMLQRSLVRFDEESRIDYEHCTNEYEKHAMDVCREALLSSGAIEDFNHPIELSIDKQGIIRWSATREALIKKERVLQPISGEIGQVPLRDSDVRPGIGFDSVYRTRFNAGDDFIFVPGYSLWLSLEGIDDPDATEENGFNMSSRLRGADFHDVFDSRIRQVVARQMTQPFVIEKVSTMREKKKGTGMETEDIPRIPICLDATSLNDTYTKDTYGSRLDINFFDVNRLDLSTENSKHTEAFIKTMTHKGRFPTRMRNTNTTSAARRYAAAKRYDNDSFSPADDLAFKLSGYQSMRVPRANIWGGYFDIEMIGSDQNQGIAVYLADGVEFENRRFTPVAYDPETDPIPRCAFAYMDEFRYIDYDMSGRTRMVSNQLVGAKRIMNDVHICYSTFYGWTFDDAYVVSKEFAEKAEILDSDGNPRILQKGDKLSDFGGNKGVISLVVDRNWTSEDLDRLCGDNAYKREMYEKALSFFKANPDLEAVGSPFGPMSRDNASVIMKGLEGHGEKGANQLVHPDGHVDGSMGVTDLLIPHQTVDEKTTTYENPGEGRKVSSQLAWAMASKKAHGLVKALFNENASYWSDLREYFIATGLDLSADGTISTHGYTPYKVSASETEVASTDPVLVDEERNTFSMFDLERDANGALPAVDAKLLEYMTAQFKRNIGVTGGFMLLPTDFGQLPDDIKRRAESLGLNTDFTMPSFYGDSRGSVESRKALPIVTGEDGKEYYQIPVLPPHLRKDSRNLDGTYTTHDFTLQYESMYKASLQWYSDVARVIESGKAMDDKDFMDLIASANRITNFMSNSFDVVQSNIIQKLNGQGTGKYSYFRDELQGVRVPNSATSVFMPDPTLPIGEVAMDRDVMKSLNVRDGEPILVWRDPVLRDGALRCVIARFDSSVHGVSMNPFCDYSMDGDFDGDTLGMIKIPDKAKEEAINKFGYGNNMLEFGAEPTIVDGKENAPLYFNISMDVMTAEALNPSLTKLREDIENEANDLHRKSQEKKADLKSIRKQQDKLVERLTDYSQKVYETAGDYMHTIDFTSRETVFNSFRRMALDGSKGSASKLYDLLQYANWEVHDKETGRAFDKDTLDKGKDSEWFDEWFAKFEPVVKVGDHPFVGTFETEQCNEASSIKTDDTGSAGTKSQKAMAAMREKRPDVALNVTYFVTQALLQIKKDPVMAHRMDTLVCTDMATLFSGQVPRCFYDDDKTKLEDIKTADKFADTFYRLLTDKDKMNLKVSRTAVQTFAKSLCRDGNFYAPDEYMRKYGSVLDYISYGATDNEGERIFDILQTLDNHNFHKTVDGKDAVAASAFVPDKIAVARGTNVSYGQELREQFADKVGVKTEGLNRAANEIKRIRELREEISTTANAMMDGMEQGTVSPGKLREMREDIDTKQDNLNKLLEEQNKRADTVAYTKSARDNVPE